LSGARGGTRCCLCRYALWRENAELWLVGDVVEDWRWADAGRAGGSLFGLLGSIISHLYCVNRYSTLKKPLRAIQSNVRVFWNFGKLLHLSLLLQTMAKLREAVDLFSGYYFIFIFPFFFFFSFQSDLTIHSIPVLAKSSVRPNGRWFKHPIITRKKK